MASLGGAGESVAVVNSIGRLLRGEAGNATPEDLASDRAAPVSGAIVPAYGAWPGRITPCHLSCIRLVLEGNNDVHYEPPFVPSAASGNVCPVDDPAEAGIAGVAVSPGDVAADHAVLFAVGGVVGAVECELAQRGELTLQAVHPRGVRRRVGNLDVAGCRPLPDALVLPGGQVRAEVVADDRDRIPGG